VLNLLHIFFCVCYENPTGLITAILSCLNYPETAVIKKCTLIFQATNLSSVCLLWTELFLLWCGGDVHWSLSGGQTGRSREKPAHYMDKVLQKEETHHSSSLSSPYSRVSSINSKYLEICLWIILFFVTFNVRPISIKVINLSIALHTPSLHTIFTSLPHAQSTCGTQCKRFPSSYA